MFQIEVTIYISHVVVFSALPRYPLYLNISISISLLVIVGYYPVDWSSLSEVTSSVL